jgi:hypothetical protein
LPFFLGGVLAVNNPSNAGALIPDRPTPKSGAVRVIVETPRGSRNKFKYLPELDVFSLDRLTPVMSSANWPFSGLRPARSRIRFAISRSVHRVSPLTPSEPNLVNIPTDQPSMKPQELSQRVLEGPLGP